MWRSTRRELWCTWNDGWREGWRAVREGSVPTITVWAVGDGDGTGRRKLDSGGCIVGCGRDAGCGRERRLLHSTCVDIKVASV